MPDRSPVTVILAYDGLCVFEFGIAFELFGLHRPELDVDWYDCRIVGLEGKKVRAPGGIAIEASAPIEALDEAGTIVIPGWRDRNERPPEQILEALRRAHHRGAVLISICSGAYVLAQAGLLDGKGATTHWRYADGFAAAFPLVDFIADVLYVDEGQVITSAGSAAGIDAGLHLIRRDYGAAIANKVARRLVMPPHRRGGQSQYVETPVAIRPGRTIGQTLDWARERLDQPLSIGQLANQAAMSERTFLRHFSAATGLAPKKWLQMERIGRAKDLLETTDVPLEGVSLQCGFGSMETFRIAFRREVGVPPGTFRSRFAG
jgi:AraC family transcriptional activator FtrA